MIWTDSARITTLRRRRFFIVGAFAFPVLIVSWGSSTTAAGILATASAGVVGGAWTGAFMLVVVSPRRGAQRLQRLDPDIYSAQSRVRVTLEGVEMQTPRMRATYKWGAVTGFVESAEVIGIELGKRTALVVIPKRVLTEHQSTELRSRLAAGLSSDQSASAA